MTDTSRIDDLRRRVDKDPASIAFAQLAEECRRAGDLHEAIRVCRAGLAIHPNYLSARVTLGRALLQTASLDDARREFERVLEAAPSNLAAVRGLADTLQRQDALADALREYQLAHTLAPNDPDIDRRIAALSAALALQTSQSERRQQEALLGALQQWLTAIHVTRTERHA